MNYSNEDPKAIVAMELERTGYYGDICEYNVDICPVCGAVSPDCFYMNDDEDCVGCYECLYKVYDLF